MLTNRDLRKAMHGATSISEEVMAHIYQERWLQIWVPKEYGGLGYDFKTGLASLYEWAKIDGSLGWMLTLCAGANYFARNITPNTAKELFSNATTCFGGSGMIGGTAEKQTDGQFLIQGLWHYATGAPYLSHFTLNAKLIKNGRPCLDQEGNEIIHSFILNQNQARIIPNWKSMGMKATGTFSFEVEPILIPENHHFIYDTFYTDDIVTRIPFRLFADLTLLVNYLGMASHFIEEASQLITTPHITETEKHLEKAIEQIMYFAQDIEAILMQKQTIPSTKQTEIHQYGVELVAYLSQQLIKIHVLLGIKHTQIDQPIYQVFCDFFTATQHANFRSESK